MLSKLWLYYLCLLVVPSPDCSIFAFQSLPISKGLVATKRLQRSDYGSLYSSSSSASNNHQPPQNSNTKKKKSGGGYQFGDITRGVLGKVQKDVNSLTGKSTYEFGDLSKWLDQEAKKKATEFTHKKEYEFGDITKEIVHRIREGEYSEEELMLLLKLVVTVGIQFQPIARLLPVKALVQMLNISMSQKLTDQVRQILTKELESRLPGMIGGNLKQKMFEQAVLTFTGKEKYQVGDIALAINERRSSSSSSSNSGGIVLDHKTEKELDDWDKKNKK